MALGKGLCHQLDSYVAEEYLSFHTPGHKGRLDFLRGIKFPAFDLTELPGLDMLHTPRGVIAEAQLRASMVFGSEETYFLVNGGTSGNQAMFMSLEHYSGKKVLVERKSHRSVMSALVLTGLDPEYIEPVIHPEFNLALGTDVENFTLANQKVIACHLTYPSYYGTVINLEAVIQERDKISSNTVILVDQAHGSHYINDLFPVSSIRLGADLVLNSTHKTLGSLTQSAMLHVQGNLVNRTKLRQSLEIIQSSSPSYLLMASLELATESALLYRRWHELYEEVEQLHHDLGNKIRILSKQDAGCYGISELDWSKILINTASLGIPAGICVEYLRQNYKIEPEMWDDDNILFMLGIGNTAEDVKLLSQSLQKLLDSAKFMRDKPLRNKNNHFSLPKVPKRLTPRDAFFSGKRQVQVRDSIGLIAAETISPYPPGIPLIVMGEEITAEVREYLLAAGNDSWQGWDGKKDGSIWVVDS